MTFAHRGNSCSGEPLQDRRRIIELYNDIRPALGAYLCSCGLSWDHSEDIIQETFLRLVRYAANANADDDFRGWVFRVAHNLSMDLHRSERRWFRGNETEAHAIFQESVDPAPNPEEMILLAERLTHLRAALSQLTPKQRECLLLRAKGLRYREIAVVLGVSVQRVGELMQRVISLVEMDCRKSNIADSTRYLRIF
jgi:RNA polymerase sigma-70 factor, ECF subfamily